MKKLMTAAVGVAFLMGTLAFAQAPAQTDQPKAEKKSKKPGPKQKKRQTKTEAPKA